MVDTDKIAILLPVFNEELYLRDFLNELKQHAHHILAVNDGSTDQSMRILQEEGIRSISSSRNMGKGAAIRKGFELLKKEKYDWVVVMDADGQHSPEDLHKYINDEVLKKYDVINGYRKDYLDRMPKVRLLTNQFMSNLISLVAGQKLIDVQCGYKLFSMKFIREARLKTNRFEIEDELLLEAVRLGYRIGYVPISTIYRKEKSHINPVTDTVRFFLFLIRRIMIRSRA